MCYNRPVNSYFNVISWFTKKKKKKSLLYIQGGGRFAKWFLSHTGRQRTRREECEINNAAKHIPKHTFLGLLAKIKCSICSYNGEGPVSVAWYCGSYARPFCCTTTQAWRTLPSKSQSCFAVHIFRV